MKKFAPFFSVLIFIFMTSYCFAIYTDVPMTGQRISYAAGDDGDLQKGVSWPSPRFTDNRDGTVSDNLTGLVWLKNANCFGLENWSNALNGANGLSSGNCGLTDGSEVGDWSLPNINELESLLDVSQNDPPLPIGHPFTFPDYQSGNRHWSSTSLAYEPASYAWQVDTGYGYAQVFTDRKIDHGYVWPVRKVQLASKIHLPKTGQMISYAVGDDGDLQKGVSWPSPRFTDNRNGTVSDNLTGLVWLKNTNCFGLENWSNALNAANGLSSGNCGLTDGSKVGDWRLPNRRELTSMVDLSHFSPAFPTGHMFSGFNAVDDQNIGHWSSNTINGATDHAIQVYTGYALLSAAAKSGLGFVWAVREGVATDGDGDGYSEENGDCNDSNADVNPGIIELASMCGDGIDQDCNGTDLACQVSPPTPPHMSYTTSGLNITVDWTTVPNATDYKLYYAPYPYTGPNSIGSFDMGSATSFSIDLWEGAKYYIAATAKNPSGESEYSNIELFTITKSENQAVLGPLSGAIINIFRFSDLENPLEGPIYTTSSNDVKRAGEFTATLNGVPSDEWVLVQASEGTDIDPNNDGVSNELPEENKGHFFCVAKVADLRAGGVKINPLCDLIYQAKINEFLKIDEVGSEYIAEMLDELSEQLVDDVNLDGLVDYSDILSFNPSQHKDLFVGNWESFLDNYVALIHKGSSQFARDDMASILSSFLMQEHDADNVNGQAVFNRLGTRPDGNIDEVSHASMSDDGIIMTSLEESNGQIIGNTGLLVDGKQINLSYISDIETLGKGTTNTLDSTQFKIKKNGSDYVIDIPKELFASWAGSDGVVMIDGEEYTPDVIDDDPILGITPPPLGIVKDDFVRPYNVKTGKSGWNAYDFDVPFWNELNGNTMRFQVFYYVNYNGIWNDSNRRITVTTTAGEDDVFYIHGLMTGLTPNQGPEPKEYIAYGAGNHTGGVGYIFGPSKWLAFDSETGEYIDGNVSSGTKVDYFEFSWTQEQAYYEKNNPFFIFNETSLDLETSIKIRDTGLSDTNENMDATYPIFPISSEINLRYRKPVVVFSSIETNDILYYNRPLNIEMKNKYWGDGKKDLRLTFKCSGDRASKYLDQIDIPSDRSNFQSTTYYQDSSLGYDDEETGCTFRLYETDKISFPVGESPSFSIKASPPAAKTLLYVKIEGTQSVGEGERATYKLTATWSDGSKSNVTSSATWSVSSSSYASINAGELTARNVSSNKSVTIRAIYTSGGITKDDTYNVTIVNDAPVVVDKDDDGYSSSEDCNDNVKSIHPGATEICGDQIDNDCDSIVDENCTGGTVTADFSGVWGQIGKVEYAVIMSNTSNSPCMWHAEVTIMQNGSSLSGSGMMRVTVGSKGTWGCEDYVGTLTGSVDGDVAEFSLGSFDFNGVTIEQDESMEPYLFVQLGDFHTNNINSYGTERTGSAILFNGDYYGTVVIPPTTDPNDTDNDGDDYSWNQGDCNDNNSSIHPGATEICGDGIDQDCNNFDMECPPPVGLNSLNVIGTWNYVYTSNACPGKQEAGTLTWSYSGGYYMSSVTSNALDDGNCLYEGYASYPKIGPYSANNPISSTELSAGLNIFPGWGPYATAQKTVFESNNQIVVTGTSKLSGAPIRAVLTR